VLFNRAQRKPVTVTCNAKMTNETTIRQSLTSRLSDLRANTIIIDDSDKLKLNGVENGILIVYATWSELAIANCIQAISTLYKSDYSGKLLVIDIDVMTIDFQIDLLGNVCHGWGEIFLVLNGVITEKYLGKDSYHNFKTDLDNKKHSR